MCEDTKCPVTTPFMSNLHAKGNLEDQAFLIKVNKCPCSWDSVRVILPFYYNTLSCPFFPFQSTLTMWINADKIQSGIAHFQI